MIASPKAIPTRLAHGIHVPRAGREGWLCVSGATDMVRRGISIPESTPLDAETAVGRGDLRPMSSPSEDLNGPARTLPSVVAVAPRARCHPGSRDDAPRGLCHAGFA